MVGSIEDNDHRKRLEILFQDASTTLSTDLVKRSKEVPEYFAWYDVLSDEAKKIIQENDPVSLCDRMVSRYYIEVGLMKTVLTEKELDVQVQSLLASNMVSNLDAEACEIYRYLQRCCAGKHILQCLLADDALSEDELLKQSCHEYVSECEQGITRASDQLARKLLDSQFDLSKHLIDKIFDDIESIQRKVDACLSSPNPVVFSSYYRKLSPISKKILSTRLDGEIIRRKMLLRYINICVDSTIESDSSQAVLSEISYNANIPISYLAERAEIALTQFACSRFNNTSRIQLYTSRILLFYVMTILGNFWDEMCFYQGVMSRDLCLEKRKQRQDMIDMLIVNSLTVCMYSP